MASQVALFKQAFESITPDDAEFVFIARAPSTDATGMFGTVYLDGPFPRESINFDSFNDDPEISLVIRVGSYNDDDEVTIYDDENFIGYIFQPGLYKPAFTANGIK